MWRELFERYTGRPYFTGRSAAADFGPPPGAEFADLLAPLTDVQVMRFGRELIAEQRRHQLDQLPEVNDDEAVTDHAGPGSTRSGAREVAR